MTVDGLYWDEAGRADVGMIEPGDTVYCICRGADGLFSVSSGVCVDPPVRFIDFGDGAQFLHCAEDGFFIIKGQLLRSGFMVFNLQKAGVKRFGFFV